MRGSAKEGKKGAEIEVVWRSDFYGLREFVSYILNNLEPGTPRERNLLANDTVA